MAWIRSNKKGSGGGGEIPAKYLYSFTKEKEWVESGITASGWYDDTGTTALTEEWNYNPTVGEYVSITGSTWESFPVPNSYYMFGIRVRVDPNFVPRTSGGNSWYGSSCIMGQELASVQKDCGIIVTSDGYFGLGRSNTTNEATSVYALDGNIHDIFLIVLPTKIIVMIDGNIEIERTEIMTGNDMTKIGVGNCQKDAAFNTTCRVYRVGYWSYTEPTGEIVEETVPTL